MITTHLMGGLGNQMFQLFCGMALSLRNDRPFVLLSTYLRNFNGREDRPTYWDNIFSGMCRYIKFAVNLPDIYQIKEQSFSYSPITMGPIILGRNIMINGYYQSEKYFKDQFDQIYHICKFEGMQKKILEKYLKNRPPTHNPMSETISMHFRLGDYKNLTHIHPIMTYTYYCNSLIHILNNLEERRPTTSGLFQLPKILYFCEEEDISIVSGIIDKLSREFAHRCVFERAGDSSYADWEQMLLMSCCENHIIANSSFSWWGAYLNRNPNKIVCYPSVWFGSHTNHDTRDLCPSEWIPINCA
jgi:hypothetical protein